MTSTFVSNAKVVLGQSKAKEIITIPELLLIKGSTITIDAMGQKNIVKKIIEKQADYVLALKNNQKDLFENIKTYFDNPKAKYNFYKYIDKRHGRIEMLCNI